MSSHETKAGDEGGVRGGGRQGTLLYIFKVRLTTLSQNKTGQNEKNLMGQ